MFPCYCCSQKSYDECCEPFISGKEIPKNPESLMRSRYSAFVMANTDYVKNTMRGKALENFDEKEAKEWMQHMEWLNLEVLSSTQNENKGTVEFVTTTQHCNGLHREYELSQFERVDDVWYYISGKTKPYQPAKQKIGRNDACPCGSGKKYKKCCQNK